MGRAHPIGETRLSELTTPAGPHGEARDFWFARLAVALVAILQLLLINDLSVGPRWLAPAIELAILVPLSMASVWHHERWRRGHYDRAHDRRLRHSILIRRAAITLTALVSAMNFAAIVMLVRSLLAGRVQNGATLLVDAINLWSINVIVFALWYWAVDRGGPSTRNVSETEAIDFLFPQMTAEAERRFGRFAPGFVDYLFLSFTNATAFSPTDTLPLTHRAKLLMMLEAAVSLVTVALVAARAVNILSSSG